MPFAGFGVRGDSEFSDSSDSEAEAVAMAKRRKKQKLVETKKKKSSYQTHESSPEYDFGHGSRKKANKRSKSSDSDTDNERLSTACKTANKPSLRTPGSQGPAGHSLLAVPSSSSDGRSLSNGLARNSYSGRLRYSETRTAAGEVCRVCGKEGVANLQRHLGKDHNAEVFTCDKCPKVAYISIQEALEHAREFHQAKESVAMILSQLIKQVGRN